MSAIPAGDLTKLRAANHKTRLYLIVQQPMTQDSGGDWTGYLWSAQINGAPAGTAGDLVADLTVDNADAGPVDLLDGMTVFVGTTKGDHDKGVFRVRGDQTVNGATVSLDIGATSGVVDVIEDDDYVVVLEEFRLWTRYPRITEAGGVLSWYKDYDVTWDSLGATDAARRQASYPPVPVMGPHRVEFIAAGGSASVDFDWSDSYATASGATVDDWDAYGQDGGAGWSVLNTENPPAQTYTNVSGLGGYRVRLEVGSDVQDPPARFRRGIRYVFTLRRPGQTQAGDPDNAEPITEFAVTGLQGTWDEGMWRATITIFDSQASEVDVWEGALVILFADDWYGSTAGSIGPVSGAENVVFVGRVADGTVRQDDETGDVTFDVLSAAGQARNREMYPIPLENDGAADEWYKAPDLTVDRAAWFYLVWHSTVPLICDWYDSDDTEEIRAIDFLAGDVYGILDGFYRDRLFARVLCDRYERWKADVDLQMQTAASGTTSFSSAVVSGQTEWLGEMSFRDTSETPVGIVEVGGLNYNAGLITPYLAKAPGTVNRLKGRSESSMNLAIADQATLNTLAGRWLAKLNNRWPQATMPLAGNWRYPDIWPQEYVNLTLATERHTFSSDLFIVRGVQFDHDPLAGALFATLTLELETDGPDGQTIDIPLELPTRPLPPKPYYPPAPPPTPTIPTASDTGRRILATDVGVFVTDDIGASSPVWYGSNDGLSTALELNVLDIKRDPYRWWTTGGTARRLYAFTKRGIFYQDDFPFGTWVHQIDRADILAATGQDIDTAPINTGRMNLSIEEQDLYAMAYSIGDDAFDQKLIANTVESGAITQSTVINTWSEGWDYIIFAPHSAGNTLYWVPNIRYDNVIDSNATLRKSLDRGASWSSVDGPYGYVDGGYYTSIGVPYVDAANPDLYILWGRGGNLAGSTGRYRISVDAGVTWTNLQDMNHQYSMIASGGDPDYFFLLADRPDLTPCKYTTNRGGSYIPLPLMSGTDIYMAAFVLWSGMSLRSVLVGSGSNPVVQIWEPGLPAWVDKTGNLASFGVGEIRTIDRDSMGVA